MSNDDFRFPNITAAVGSGEADALAVVGVLLESETSAKQWMKTVRNKSGPDTRPIPVADGWAGAEMRVFTLSNSITTDGRTDGGTKPLIKLCVRN